jgi:hypothetical protein
MVVETFETIKRFFAEDEEVKMEAHVQKNPAIRGYEPMFETKLDPRTRGGKSNRARFPRPITEIFQITRKLSQWVTVPLIPSKTTSVKPDKLSHHT